VGQNWTSARSKMTRSLERCSRPCSGRRRSPRRRALSLRTQPQPKHGQTLVVGALGDTRRPALGRAGRTGNYGLAITQAGAGRGGEDVLTAGPGECRLGQTLRDRRSWSG
jgi:hypothetical protein